MVSRSLESPEFLSDDDWPEAGVREELTDQGLTHNQAVVYYFAQQKYTLEQIAARVQSREETVAQWLREALETLEEASPVRDSVQSVLEAVERCL